MKEWIKELWKNEWMRWIRGMNEWMNEINNEINEIKWMK